MSIASRLVVVLAVAACGRSETRATREPAPTQPPVVVSVAQDAAVASPIALATRQLITVIVPNWNDTTAEIRLWKRDADRWVADGSAWQAVVGKSGTGWGAGLHGQGPPPGRAGPTKREGDGKSPAGVFALGGSFGYGANAPATTGLPYQQVDPSWKCVDDPKSAHYNTILDQRTTKPDWTSAEEMRRSDELYTWVVDIAHNATRVPGAGSCIFFHVWGGPGSSTVGCTAMDERKLTDLMSKLTPGAKPALVLLPRAEYDALATAWQLPRN
jgi:L,D-peptidoglycan transpeptidase YkuD (ErfK/YbiS/YcfS/YnhG family)